MIKASAPGKMILIGEYAVLEGAPSLVCAVNRRADVSIHILTGKEFSVSSPSLGIAGQPFVLTHKMIVRFDPNIDKDIFNRLQFFQNIFEATLEHISSRIVDIPAMNINLNTDAFYSRELNSKYGFGSSAALTVALVSAMFRTAGYSADESELFYTAMQIHHKAQGNLGSGIDIAASNYGGVLEYKRTFGQDAKLKIPRKIKVWPDIHILPIWSGRSASTRKMVSGVNRLKEEKPSLYDEIIERLFEISATGCEAYEKQEAKPFLESVELFYDSLSKLGQKSAMPIISERHQEIYNTVRKIGGYYKPSGAGSGDIGLAFSDDVLLLDKLKKVLTEKGISLLDVEVDSKGVEVIDS